MGPFRWGHRRCYSLFPNKRGLETIARYNNVNIQMLPANLQAQLFKGPQTTPSPQCVQLSQSHLRQHDIPIEQKKAELANVDMKLPPLIGHDIRDHFRRVSSALSEEYKAIIDEFWASAVNEPTYTDYKWMEGKWKYQSGWTKYEKSSGEVIGKVDFPKERFVVFDIENCKSFGPLPLMAIASSKNYIYGWVSPHLISGECAKLTPASLIGFAEDYASIVVGHNVSYDRARILGEYKIKSTRKRKFIDTLSMHSAVAGLSSQQRPTIVKAKAEKSTKSSSACLSEVEDVKDVDDGFSGCGKADGWTSKSSLNNLKDAVKLHCNYEMDKDALSILTKGTIEDVQDNFQTLMTYCANDVHATKILFQSLWPKFMHKCSHPVTLAAFLEMGSCFLPVTRDWNVYYEKCEAMFREATEKIESLLRELVESTVNEYQPHSLYAKDAWLRNLDWTPVPHKYTKERRKKDGSFAKNGEPRPIGNAKLFGKPAWYKKLYVPKTDRVEITVRNQIVPYLLRMKWNGFPVRHLAGHGWCFGGGEDKERLKAFAIANKASTIIGPESDAGHTELFIKIPHQEDERLNVGSLVTKHHLKQYGKGVLTTDSHIIKEILSVNSAFSFWVSYRERIRNQFIVWQENGIDFNIGDGKDSKHSSSSLGLILPNLIVMGTVTRRAVEATWMTATNAKKALVGTEMKSKIQAPPGYVFVGADVDSQELWISSALGDAEFGFPGATAMGWMTLQGAKAEGTDLHSKTAKILGMGRGEAKIFTYGRIYGAGVKYATQLLHKFNPAISSEEAKEKAEKLYAATKGQKVYGRSRDGGQTESFYFGGTESFMFNKLESIARSEKSKTPVLQCEISDALIKANVDEEYMTSRVNWSVQSSGVDYLHLLVVSMAYLIHTFNIDARLSLTIHDEIRYLVKEEEKFRAAYALQIANLWTRVMFTQSMGMSELPLSVAFFSAIDFDVILRKEVDFDCITPSNLEAIKPGIAMDIYELTKMVPNGLGAIRKPLLFNRAQELELEQESFFVGPPNLSNLKRQMATTKSEESTKQLLRNSPITRRSSHTSNFIRSNHLWSQNVEKLRKITEQKKAPIRSL